MEGLRRSVDDLCKKLEEAYYYAEAGLSDNLNIEAFYNEYSDLFSAPILERVKSELQQTQESEGRRRLRYLLEFLQDQRIEREMSTLTEEYYSSISERYIEINDKKIPYISALKLLHDEPDRRKRASIEKERLKVIRGLHDISIQMVQKRQEVVRRMGYKNYLDYCTADKSFSLSDIKRQMGVFLASTEEIYRKALSTVVPKATDISLHDFAFHDLGIFAGASSTYSRILEGKEPASVFYTTLQDLGILETVRRRISVDAEKRDKKMGRGFYAPITIPHKIILVVNPLGGLEDFRVLLHEGGHCVHYASIDKSHPFEYKRLGDPGVSEAYAFLFERLLESSAWLSRHVRPVERDKEEFLQYMLAFNLYLMRRTVASALFEMELYKANRDDEIRTKSAVFSEVLTDALLFSAPSEYFLSPGIGISNFHNINYFRAWCFEAKLRAALVDRFGQEWFRLRQAGDFLQDLFRYGAKYPLEELTRMYCIGELGEQCLVDDLVAQFSKYKWKS